VPQLLKLITGKERTSKLSWNAFFMEKCIIMRHQLPTEGLHLQEEIKITLQTLFNHLISQVLTLLLWDIGSFKSLKKRYSIKIGQIFSKELFKLLMNKRNSRRKRRIQSFKKGLLKD